MIFLTDWRIRAERDAWSCVTFIAWSSSSDFSISSFSLSFSFSSSKSDQDDDSDSVTSLFEARDAWPWLGSELELLCSSCSFSESTDDETISGWEEFELEGLLSKEFAVWVFLNASYLRYFCYPPSPSSTKGCPCCLSFPPPARRLIRKTPSSSCRANTAPNSLICFASYPSRSWRTICLLATYLVFLTIYLACYLFFWSTRT